MPTSATWKERQERSEILQCESTGEPEWEKSPTEQTHATCLTDKTISVHTQKDETVGWN